MKIIVTHSSPDWDAITSVWLLKRFFPGWNTANIQFVPAGERIGKLKAPIEKIDGDEVIHVDTGMGPLDHHETNDQNVCAASRTLDFVKRTQNSNLIKTQNYEGKEHLEDKLEAIDRIVRIVVDIDHFKEVFWDNPTADYHEFSLLGVLEGLKLQKPDDDEYYVEFGMQVLDALVHNFKNRIWAEIEIKEKGIEFSTRYGKGIGFETINDSVVKLAQKMGYVLAVRKDPRKGYVRIKARPSQTQNEIELTLAYEKLKKIDPEATWYLHVSKKMLLNGTPKNPKMKATKLSLDDIIRVLETI